MSHVWHEATAECLGLSASLRAFPCGKGIYYYLLVSEKTVENQKIMIIKVIIYQRLMNPFNPDNVLPRS